MSNCCYRVSPVNYPDPDPRLVILRDGILHTYASNHYMHFGFFVLHTPPFLVSFKTERSDILFYAKT